MLTEQHPCLESSANLAPVREPDRARPLRLLAPLIVGAMIFGLPRLASAATGSDAFAAYQERGWIWMYLASFGFGFLTSLTPCVYPMIPITLGIFGARGQGTSRGRRLLLAAAYVVGMGLTYSVLGVTFALLGKQSNTLLSNPYVIIPIVLLFVAMAASMFGAFDINLPSSWQAKLNQVGGSGFRGAFAMGLVGGIIAAPCTGPFLAGILAFVTSTRSVFGGGSMLFVYALGMGVLFFVLAGFAMALPKSGPWMDNVKSAAGLLLLIGAIYFLRPLLPFMRRFAAVELWFLAASIALIVLGLGLGAIHLSFHGPWRERMRKLFGIALVLVGVFGAWGWYLAPKNHLPWIRGDEGAAYTLALQSHKGVMVDFGASWCTACDELERTFGYDDVFGAITDNFVPLKLDVSKGTPEQLALQQKYNAKTLPAVRFVRTDGEVIGTVSEFTEPEPFLELIGPVIAALHPAPPARAPAP